MNKRNNIQDEAALFEQFEQLRLSLLQSQDALIDGLKKEGMPTVQALKDWQDTFCRITSAQSEIVKQIREKAQNN